MEPRPPCRAHRLNQENIRQSTREARTNQKKKLGYSFTVLGCTH
ncbi:predicted protein [Plenodomus lingam JN3]|uniref:Predicted protein n=1 Tax=Leptosphaeria maculans (strain JN3 / isolate v23.1.3 / race Av1-4-5-6-7-8) TaxID=985895 RepID=E4ZUV1_LEPMJ|nr:predicted protein [Plenodomus lingam JN3]CBX95180.1 predicted protein [Plenodomus lingam JN3]